jgi:hypothetical protein
MKCTLDLSCESILEVPVFECEEKYKPFVQTIGEALGIDNGSNYQSDLIVDCGGTMYIFSSSESTETGYDSYIDEKYEIFEDQLTTYDENDSYNKVLIDRVQDFFSEPIKLYFQEA